MSTSPAKTAAAAAASKDGAPADAPSHPVRILPSPAAQTFNHVHPVLLLSLFLLRFRALVADPVATMTISLPAVAAIQAAYALVCLPPVGSPAARKPHGKARPGEKKKAAPVESSAATLAVTTIVALVLSAVAAAAIHAVLVLFGAPFLTHLSQTFLCSLHLALLGLYPLFYARGVGAGDWLEVLSGRAPLDAPFGGLVGACAGAWLGAVPIPLDWDREWQKWPVTLLCGIFAGHALGKLVGGTLAFGKRFGQ